MVPKRASASCHPGDKRPVLVAVHERGNAWLQGVAAGHRQRGQLVVGRQLRLNPVFQVDVFVEIGRRPKVHELDFVIETADTVYATEALDNPNWVPVDVVVDEIVAILKVLALRNTVGSDHDVDFAVLRHRLYLRALLGSWREVCENLRELSLAEGRTVRFPYAPRIFAARSRSLCLLA